MSDVKTKVTDINPTDFLQTIEDIQKRQDSFALLQICERITGEKPKMWGTSIIGFGMYHYKSERSSQQGDWPLIAFSPRRQNLTVYLMLGFTRYQDLLKKLGKHKTSVSCLYIKRLSDSNLVVLEELITLAYSQAKKELVQE